ncbi:hypothetical protein L6R52_09470, partial [Myxococcota bacterium]|nr:hypothetical protein [Myxococcota bacterium]
MTRRRASEAGRPTRSAGLIWGALALAGCVDVFELEVPLAPGATHGMIVVERGASLEHAEVFDAVAVPPWLWALPRDGRTKVHVMSFGAGVLDAWQLRIGELAPTDVEGARPLPPALAIATHTLDGAWTTVTERPEVLARPWLAPLDVAACLAA